MTGVVIKGNRGASYTTAATNICQNKLENLKDQEWEDLGDGTSGSPNAESWGLPGGEMVQEGSILDPSSDPLLNGQGNTEEEVCQDVGGGACSTLNATQLEEVRKRGPYKFSRTFVICRGDEYTAGPTPPANTQANAIPGANEHPAAKDCAIDPADNLTRPERLACEAGDIISPGVDSKEKKIKILCSWTSREGRCHSVSFSTTKISLD